MGAKKEIDAKDPRGGGRGGVVVDEGRRCRESQTKDARRNRRSGGRNGQSQRARRHLRKKDTLQGKRSGSHASPRTKAPEGYRDGQQRMQESPRQHSSLQKAVRRSHGTTHEFQTGGRPFPISVERFELRVGGQRPAVLTDQLGL